MKKSFMTRILATGLSLAMAFSMAAATNVTTASAASKPAMITSAGASAKSLSLKVGEVTKIKVNAATKANYKVSAVKASSKRVRAAVVGSTVVAIRGLKATVEGKPSTVKVSFKSRKTNKTSKFTYSAKVTVIEDKLTVTGVSATDATTLTVTGTKLGDLTAADIKLTPEMAVASYAAAADGKTATVKLAAGLQSATEYTVTVNGSEFKVKYTAGEITSAAVVETTYDDDTAGQVVAITVNGGSPITVNDLVADGYYVEFSATRNGTAAKIFKDAAGAASAKSSTGILIDKFDGVVETTAVNNASYKVQVILTKGSNIVTSPVGTIKTANLNADATEIKSYEFTGTKTGTSTDTVVLTGTTLVVGETAKLTKAVITTKDGAVNLPTAVLPLVGITSSDKGVISVDTSVPGQVSIEAIAPGTATLTFAYGKVTKTVTYTVTNVARKVASVAAKDSVVRITSTGNAATTVVVKDQYGEFFKGLNISSSTSTPVSGTSEGIVYTSNASVATASAVSLTTNNKGEFNTTVYGNSVGSAYLMVSYYDANHNKTAYTAASIVATAATAADSSKNQLYAKYAAGKSTDLALNKFDGTDNTVDLALKTFTKDGALVSPAVDLNGYKFKYNKAIIDRTGSTTDTDGSTIYTVAGTATEVEFTAQAAGSTVVSLYDATNTLAATAVITVTDTTPKLTAVTFNAACPASLTTAGEYVDLTQVFTIKASSNDDIIEGLTISQAYAGELRVDIAANKADIYIDANSDGDYNAGDGDYIVGSIELTAKNPNGSAATTPSQFKYTLAAGGAEKVLYYTVYDAANGSAGSGKVVATKTVNVSL